MTVEYVRYAIGSVCKEVSCTWVDVITCKPYLDASPEDAEYLNLVFGDQLRESNQDPDLQCHLSVILHAVSGNGQGRFI